MIGLMNFIAFRYMAAIVGINSRHDLRIEVHHRNQPNKGKLAFLLSAQSCTIVVHK